MRNIGKEIERLHQELPPEVTLVCVSKFHPQESLMQAYDAGQRIFGESRVQELTQKAATLPKDIAWHFIGHLQTNKVKQVLPLTTLIHSVDSPRLLAEIERVAANLNVVCDCLVQIHIAQEEQKFGFDFEEFECYLQSEEYKQLSHVHICGLMGMATYTDSVETIKREFSGLRNYFDTIKQHYFSESNHFKELSMGMSGDYVEAIASGSTMVRIGSTIFGERM